MDGTRTRGWLWEPVHRLDFRLPKSSNGLIQNSQYAFMNKDSLLEALRKVPHSRRKMSVCDAASLRITYTSTLDWSLCKTESTKSGCCAEGEIGWVIHLHGTNFIGGEVI